MAGEASESSINKLNDTITMLAKQLAGQGSLAMGMEEQNKVMRDMTSLSKDHLKEQTAQLRLRKAQKELEEQRNALFGKGNKAIQDFSKDLYVHANLLTNSMMSATEAMNTEQFEKMNDFFINSVRDTAGALNSSDIHEFVEKMQNLSKEVEATGKSLQELRNGTEAEKELAQDYEDTARGIQQLEKRAQELNYTFGSFINDIKNKFGILTPTIGATVAAFKMAITPALRMGTDFQQSLTAFMAGMDPEEMAQNLKEYRRTINASGMTMNEFRQRTEEGALSLTGYTGSLRDAVRVQASAFEAARRFGAANDKAFTDRQVNMFKRFNKAFSMTAEEFIEMNKQIRSSQSINEQIYRLNNKQRAQYALEIQQTVLRLRTFGLMQEQAMKVVEAMAAIGAKSPKERLKEAAKLQAVGGALGFGQAATEMADIMRRGMRGEGDMERFAELQKEAQATVGEKMGSGFASELYTSQLLQTTQMEELLGPKSQFADLNTEQNMATQSIEQYSKKGVETLGFIQGTLNRIFNLISGPLAVLLTGIAGSLAASKAAGSVSDMFGNMTGGGGMGGIVKKMLPVLTGVGLVGTLVAAIVPIAMGAIKGHEDRKKEGSVALTKSLSPAQKKLMSMQQEEMAATIKKQLGAAEQQAQGLDARFGDLGMSKAYRIKNARTGNMQTKYGNDLRTATGEVYTGAATGYERQTADLAKALHQIASNIADQEAKAETAKKEGNETAEKQHRENMTKMQETLDALTKLHESSENIAKGVSKGNDDDERRHEEITRKASNNRVQWRRVPSGAAGMG